MTAPDRQRDGGPFTAGAMCPWCGVGDVHPIREPNPVPPHLPGGLGMRTEAFSRGGVLEYRRRWDERPFEVVRTCTNCTYEWGQK